MTTIQTDLRLKLLVAGDSSLPVPAEFTYDLSDPLSIHVVFHAAGDTVEWVFARDLMDAGLGGDSGLGDVRMWPGSHPAVDPDLDTKVLYIALNSPEGEALLEADAVAVKAFLDQTYELCPTGTETLDVDALIAELLS